MREILICIEKDVNLIITGKYFNSEYEVGLSETFEIEKIESVEEDLFDLLEWVSSNSDYMNKIEQLCISKING